ncbi:L,D-transpeptidase family protein [Labrys wisconsinensis]|uniref:Murein L,D-transpeptidase YcbB/YkuD n=1 Tax=Labrys wisconsinensis TaxID=425677 RepID=A0ABU0JGP4_9HYPH|nr:L,D-transpeptidase family protein [Labrys wisconsinensis]MDQ0472573.1 murein L,D-transpeptidase YcbB/YkuD [Labrys wisconsinensis]
MRIALLPRLLLAAVLAAAFAPSAGAEDSHPAFTPDTAAQTARALARYQQIAADGGWPALPANAAGLKPGAKGPAVAKLKERLAITGDLDESESTGDDFDEATRQALLRFQERHGLSLTGTIGRLTFAALTVPVETRINQLNMTLARLQYDRFPFAQRYVVVNIPGAAAEAVENGTVVRRFTAVVGRKDRQSPVVAAQIKSVKMLPDWTVPETLIREDIMPKMRQDPGFLAASHMRVLSWKGVELDPATIDWSGASPITYMIRQDPGPDNSLGFLKLDMPNVHAVYMHDTPHRELFRNDVRFNSSGCTRIAGVQDLAAWLMQGTEWTGQAIQAQIDSGEPKTVPLPKPVPVAWVYFTAWGTPDGLAQFRDDVYGLDTPEGVAQSRIYGPPKTAPDAGTPAATGPKPPAAGPQAPVAAEPKPAAEPRSAAAAPKRPVTLAETQ